MRIIIIVIAIAFPFFAVILTGVLAGRLGIIHQEDAGALNRFVFRIAMPVALFGLTSRSASIQLVDGIYSGVYLVAALIIIGVSYFAGRFFLSLEKPDAGVHAYGSTLGNAVFLGLPIAQSIEGLARPFIVLMLVEGGIIITLASILIAAKTRKEEEGASDLSAGKHWRELALRPFKNPLVMGALGGFGFSLLPFTMPTPIGTFLDILGRAAGPTALFSLGLFLSTTKVERHVIFSKNILLITVLKMVLLPLMVFSGLTLVGVIDRTIIAACLLFTILPSGVTVYIQASQRGRYIQEAATAIAVTTCLSVMSVSALLYFIIV